MATGLPSVGFRSADAVKDLIVDGRNGILCEDGAPAFAKGLERLMKDQDLRVKLGRQAVEDMKPYAHRLSGINGRMLLSSRFSHSLIRKGNDVCLNSFFYQRSRI